MTIRFIAIDLDGTTLRRDGTISPRTVAALSRATDAGVTVSIATGRIFGAAAAFARRLGATGPVISANGGLIRTLSGQVLRHLPLPPAVFAAVPLVARETGVRLELFQTNTLYASDLAGKRRELWGRVKRVRSWRAFSDLLDTLRCYRVRPLRAWRPADGRPEKLFIGGGAPAALRAACALVAEQVGEPLTVTSSGGDNLEVTAAGATKGSAVAWLAEHLGIGMDEVMVVGDNLNDLSMFELDCFKVAMGNAETAILERASVVTASNVDDGVARAVERYVLGEAAV